MKYSNSREQAKESEMQHSKEKSISVLRTLKASESAMQHSKAFDDMKKRYLKATESAMQQSKEQS